MVLRLRFLLFVLVCLLAPNGPALALASYPYSVQDEPGSSTGAAAVALGVPDYAFVNDFGAGFGGTSTAVFGTGEAAVFAFPYPLRDVAGEDDLFVSAFVGGAGETDEADVRVEVSTDGVAFTEIATIETDTGRTTYPLPQERNFSSVKHFGVDFAGEDNVTHVRLTVLFATAEGLRLDALEGVHPDVGSDHAFEVRFERYRVDASERFLVRIKNIGSPGGEPLRSFFLEKLPVNEWMEDTIHPYLSSNGDMICVAGCVGDADQEPGVTSAFHEWSVNGVDPAPAGQGLDPGHWAAHERYRNIDIDTGVAMSYLGDFTFEAAWADGTFHGFDYDNDVQKEIGQLYQKYTYFSSTPSLSGPRPVDYYEFVLGSLYACSDGIDNDGDGGVDYGDDVGCTSPTDDDEKDPALPCDDGIDNDGDLLVDYPNDPGCQVAWSSSEDPECSNGIDDDGDGATDYPADPGCFAAWSVDESPQCSDGIDNDGDQLVDLADPECLNTPYRNREDGKKCGLGFELAFLLPAWMALRRRLRSV